MHLTLKFIGDPGKPIEKAGKFIGDPGSDALEELINSLAAVRFVPFDLQLNQPGAFPDEVQPRVIWMGVDHSPDLLALQRKVELAVSLALNPGKQGEGAGGEGVHDSGVHASEGRDSGVRDPGMRNEDHEEYRPHITLARSGRSTVDRAQKFLSSIRERPVTLEGTWRVDSFALYESRRERTGAIYRILKTFPAI